MRLALHGMALAALLAPAPAAQDAGARLDALRELLAGDRDAELVERGLPAVRAGGTLADEGEAVALVARSLADLGREEEAVALLEGASVSAETRGWVLVERARLLLAEDDLAGVVRLLEERGSDPPRPRTSTPVDAWIVLARAHDRAGRPLRAGQLAQGLLEREPLHPEGPAAWHLVERAHVAAGDLERARLARAEGERMRRWHATVRAHLQRLRLDPGAVEPRFGLALAWMEVDAFPRARAELERLAVEAPGYCRLWFHLGETRRLAGETTAALAAYDRGVECDAADVNCRYQRAELRFRMGEREAARADFERLLSEEVADDPRFRAMHLRLAQLARERGDEVAAEQHAKKYRELGGTEEL